MQKSLQKKLFRGVEVVLLGLVMGLFAGAVIASDWVEPGIQAPGDNRPAPINQLTGYQAKNCPPATGITFSVCGQAVSSIFNIGVKADKSTLTLSDTWSSLNAISFGDIATKYMATGYNPSRFEVAIPTAAPSGTYANDTLSLHSGSSASDVQINSANKSVFGVYCSESVSCSSLFNKFANLRSGPSLFSKLVLGGLKQDVDDFAKNTIRTESYDIDLSGTTNIGQGDTCSLETQSKMQCGCPTGSVLYQYTNETSGNCRYVNPSDTPVSLGSCYVGLGCGGSGGGGGSCEYNLYAEPSFFRHAKFYIDKKDSTPYTAATSLTVTYTYVYRDINTEVIATSSSYSKSLPFINGSAEAEISAVNEDIISVTVVSSSPSSIGGGKICPGKGSVVVNGNVAFGGVGTGAACAGTKYYYSGTWGPGTNLYANQNLTGSVSGLRYAGPDTNGEDPKGGFIYNTSSTGVVGTDTGLRC